MTAGMVSTGAGAGSRAGRPDRARLILAGALVTAPVAAVAAVLLLSGRTALTLGILAFGVLAGGVLFLPPRGLAASRTWVVGYLVLQFPVRAVFLLSEPVEPPPIYHAWAPGTGLGPMLTTAMIQIDVALAVLAAAYVTASLRAPRRPVVREAGIDGRRFGILFAGALALLLVEIRSAGGDRTSGGDFVLAIPGLAAAGASAAVCYAFARRPAPNAAFFLAALGYNAVRVLMLGSKLSLLAAVLALIIGFASRSRPGPRDPGPGGRSGPSQVGRSLRSGLVTVVLVLVASYAFAAAVPNSERGAIGPAMAQGATNAVSRSYGVDALLAVNGYLDRGGELQQGASLAGLAWSWIPRPVWPDKPLSFSVQFGEDVFWFSSIAGESFFAPGYFGEWVINWGNIGLVVGALVFGVALAGVDAMASRPRRVLWIIVMVHLVEGSLVAQFWLAAPFLVGGYWVLSRARVPSAKQGASAAFLKSNTGHPQARRN
jgi:hypothetical protein